MRLIAFVLLFGTPFFAGLEARTVEQYFVVAKFDHVARDTKEIVFKHPKLKPLELQKLPITIDSYLKKNLELGYLPIKLGLKGDKNIESLLRLKGKEWVFAKFKQGKKSKLFINDIL